MRRLLASVVATLLLATIVLADATVILKDGRRLTGQIIESGDKVGVATEDGLKLLDRDQIERIEHDAFGRATPQERKAYRRAERAVQQVSEPAAAVAIWRRYIDGLSSDASLGPEARRQLTRWAEAMKAGKVIWVGQAMTLAEREKAKSVATDHLQKGIRQYHRADYRQAGASLREALGNWPDHPGALFYLALAHQKLRKPLEASRRYRTILDIAPDHVPTINNLAVLDCMRRQFRSGVPLIIRAASLAPDVVAVNDNAFRTMLRIEDSGVRSFESDMARIRNIAARMEAAMRSRGLVRWGTSWVTTQKYQDYKEKNEAVNAQLEALAGEIRTLEEQISVLKARIVELERLRRTAPWAHDLVRDDDGDGIPDHFYPLDVLTRERIDLLLADQYARLAAKEETRIEKRRAARRIKANRIDPPRDLDYLVLEEPGNEFLGGGPQKHSPLPEIPSLVGPTTVAELITAIRSAKAVILADDGTFLGKISDDRSDGQAIGNPDGPFGSSEGRWSLMNPQSRYARGDDDLSVNNPNAKRPPKLLLDGRMLAYITKNADLKPRVSLGDVLAVLKGE